MPHYFFDIDDVSDDRGKCLADLGEARSVARRLLADNLAQTAVDTGHYKSWSCLVRDDKNEEAVRVILALLIEDMSEPTNGNMVFQPT